MRMLTTSFATSALLTTLFSVGSPSSFAEDLPPELRGKVRKMKKGERAAIDGILLTRSLLVDLMKAAEKRARRAEATAERAKRDAKARIEAAEAAAKTRAEVAEAKAGACLADQLRRERIYENALKRGTAPSVWRSPWFTGSVGAILGAGICVGAAAATGR